ncbi:MAG: hypothetical protein MJ237_09615 [bacterium]|nr:hypothetical protein [bacterium]
MNVFSTLAATLRIGFLRFLWFLFILSQQYLFLIKNIILNSHFSIFHSKSLHMWNNFCNFASQNQKIGIMAQDVFVHYNSAAERMNAIREMINSRQIWEQRMRELADSIYTK